MGTNIEKLCCGASLNPVPCFAGASVTKCSLPPRKRKYRSRSSRKPKKKLQKAVVLCSESSSNDENNDKECPCCCEQWPCWCETGPCYCCCDGDTTNQPKTEPPQNCDEQNKVLTAELPLYDDNCHLLGYLSAGTIIRGPYCQKSKEPFLENMAVDAESSCPPECMKTSNKCDCDVAFPRWVKSKQYRSAVRQT